MWEDKLQNFYYYGADGIAVRKYCESEEINVHLKNVHGDVMGVTDERGYVIERYRYDAFGNNLTDDTTEPFGYCGEYFDDESGLVYLRNRYYDPETGRFITEDPAKDGVNWYIYCNGNPIMLIDPSGMYDREAAAAYTVKYSVPSFDTILEYDYGYNRPSVRMPQDCTNFISFCLFKGGGMKQSDDWYYKWAVNIGDHVPGEYSRTWSVSEDQFKAFTNCTGEFPNTNYANGNAICIHDPQWIASAIDKYNIQKGDVLYFLNPETNQMGHTAMIVSTENGKIIYAQHDDDKNNGNLGEYLEKNINNPEAYNYVFIVRIRDDA